MFINVLNRTHIAKYTNKIINVCIRKHKSDLFFFHVFRHNLLLEAWDLKMYMPNSYAPQG